jgi:outer membrane protein assembly factor BamB
VGATDGPAVPLAQVWRTGQPIAGGRGDSRLSSAAIVPGPEPLAVAVGRTGVVGLDVASGRVRWTAPRSTGPLVPPAVDPSVGVGGIVVVIEGQGGHSSITALDLSSRRKLWGLALTRPAYGAPTIEGGRVFIGTRDDTVIALEAASGHVAWRARLRGVVDTSPAVDGGRVFAVAEDVASGTARLYALDESSGGVQWSFAPRPFAAHASSPTVAGGLVYVGFGDLQVRAFDERTGALTWSQPVRGDFGSQASGAVAGGAFYICDREGGVYGFDARTGARLWDYQFPQFVTRAAPLVAGRFLLTGTDDGTLAALDRSTGHLAWRTTFRFGPLGPLAPAGDLVLVPSIGPRGGLIGLRHRAGALLDISSPSHLDPAVGAANFVVAGLLVGLLAFALLRWASGRVNGRDPDAAPRGMATRFRSIVDRR